MLDENRPVALVTGASRGIGKAIALEIAGQDLTVIGTATTGEGAKSISTYLQKMGVSGEGMCVDVAEEKSVSNLIRNINDKFSSPVVLVNNAGITRDNLLMRMKEAEWHDVIETNLGSISLAVNHSMECATTSEVVEKSSDNSAGLMNGASTPYFFATLAIFSSSVETIIRSKQQLSIAASIDHAIISLPQKNFIFFCLILLLPPLAGIIATLFNFI